jgi:hypothetical protein
VLILVKESFKEIHITYFIGILVFKGVFVSMENIFFNFLPKSYCHYDFFFLNFNFFGICMSLIKYGSAKGKSLK